MGQRKQTSSTTSFPWKEFLTFLGAVLVAYFGYLGIRSQIEIPIKATQTAEARSTLVAQSTVQITPVTVTSTSVPVDTLSPAPPLTPIPSATPELLSIIGTWEGVTGGFKDGSPLTEITTTVTISDSCQVGNSCGFFNTYCTYEMTLVEIEDNVHVFQTLSISGEDFCASDGSSTPARAELTLVSNSKLYFFYKTSSGSVTREGILTKQE